MKLSYNVTGSDRKALVGAISHELNAPTKYNGAPTFAYEVGGYHISQNGTVTGEDNGELEIKLLEQGFEAIERSYDGEFPFVNGADGVDQPKEEADFEDLRLTEREELGLGWERREDPQGENGMSSDDIPKFFTYQAELSDPDCPDRMEVFIAENDEDSIREAMDFCEGEVVLLELFELDENYDKVRYIDLAPKANPQATFTVSLPYDSNPEAMARLVKLVIAKETLIKSALGEYALDDLPIALGEEDGQTTLTFTWLFAHAPDELKRAVVALVSALWKFCKKAQRVTVKETAADNEKFAMRTLLVRIGMNDITNKVHRKHLLQNLTGDSAFATPASKAKWLAKHGGKKYTEEVTDNAVSE
jgi:hypothetical protein